MYKQFKEGQKRVLVATDLIGRGIDIERVNIVINYDMPETDDRKGNGADTYLHRVRPLLMAWVAGLRVLSPGLVFQGQPCVAVGCIAVWAASDVAEPMAKATCWYASLQALGQAACRASCSQSLTPHASESSAAC